MNVEWIAEQGIAENEAGFGRTHGPRQHDMANSGLQTLGLGKQFLCGMYITQGAYGDVSYDVGSAALTLELRCGVVNLLRPLTLVAAPGNEPMRQRS